MSRRGWMVILKWVLFAALIFFVGRALWKQLKQIDWRTIHFAPLPILGAAAALAIVFAARALSFRVLLHGYRANISWREAAIVGWIPQIGKYIPGWVASYAGAVALLKRFGVGGAIGLSVVLVMDGIAVLTGLVTGSPILLWAPVEKIFPLGWLWCGLVVIAGIVCLHPRVYGRLLNIALKKFKRDPIDHLPPWHNYLGPVLLGFLQWILAGVALWLTARSIVFVDFKYIPLFIAIAGLAYSISYLAPFAPGGLGVREAIFQATLVLIISKPAAVVVIAMRIVQTIVEIVIALVGWLLLKNRG